MLMLERQEAAISTLPLALDHPAIADKNQLFDQKLLFDYLDLLGHGRRIGTVAFVSGIGGLLRGDHRCVAREHEHQRGARQLCKLAEGGA